jgi:predicted homoserine dehydrogenase-like protein
MDEVRIAVAGAGQIGRRHVEEIGRNPGTRLAAIAPSRRFRGARAG